MMAVRLVDDWAAGDGEGSLTLHVAYCGMDSGLVICYGGCGY